MPSSDLDESDARGAYHLLIVDFGGVCTPSHEEYLASAAAGEHRDRGDFAIRASCIDVVRRARRAGIEVAVLSNEIDPRWVDSVPFLRTVDHLFACTDNGILKPDRRAYQRVLLVTGIAPERALFVDDGDDNVAGARALGIESVRFDPGAADSMWAGIARRLGV